MTGTIKRLNEKKFGFISVPGQKKDYFFHKSGLANVDFDELQEGDTVTFETEEGEKGPKAVRITRP